MRAVAVVLILLAVIDWIATATLIRWARIVHEPALTERAGASVILTAVATTVAIVSADYLFDSWSLGALGSVLFISGLLCVSAPQIVWVILNRRRYFR